MDFVWLLLLVVAVGVVVVGVMRPTVGFMPGRMDDDGYVPLESEVTADAVKALRFSVTTRGYKMAEVDETLATLVAEIEARDARIAELQGESKSV